MFRKIIILTLLTLPLVAANPLEAPTLSGANTGEGFHLAWTISEGIEPTAILLTVTNETSEYIIELPGDAREFIIQGSLGDVYTVQYQQQEQASAPSNPQPWGPLGYPWCAPTNFVIVHFDPLYVQNDVLQCLTPLPV